MSGLEIIALAGLVTSVGSTITQGVMANAASRRTARRLDRDAKERERLGAIESELVLESGARTQGAAIAEATAKGFTADDTVRDALASLARASAMDAATARYEAGRDARRMREQGAQTRAQGKASLISAGFSVAGSLLTGGAQIAGAGGGGRSGGASSGGSSGGVRVKPTGSG